MQEKTNTVFPILIKQALEARTYAYAPYSNYQVGAALLCEDGTIYQGCNIENAAYGPTNCGERTAFFKAISEGKRDFSMIAIVGGKAGEKPSSYSHPCGVCRQVMREFCKPDFCILVACSETDYQVYTLEALLPQSFGGDNLT